MTDRKKRAAYADWATPLCNLTLLLLFSNVLGCGADAEPADDLGVDTELADGLGADAHLGDDVGPEAELQPYISSSAASSRQPDQAVRPEQQAPVEPPNPALHRLPMENPGGLDRFRPARRLPGMP